MKTRGQETTMVYQIAFFQDPEKFSCLQLPVSNVLNLGMFIQTEPGLFALVEWMFKQ
jgi:hypothetical protein